MFVLCLNDMRSSQVEILRPVARGQTVEALRAFLARETVEPYKDDRWGKAYRRGGPLEWFNPPYDFDAHRHFVDVSDRETRALQASRHARQFWDDEIEPLPSV